MTRAAVLLAVAVLAAGCSTSGRSGSTWWNPGTWFSGSEGRSVAALEARTDKAEARLLAEAQQTAHETQLALAAAPDSRPVNVARESSDATVAALDQLAGPLSVADLDRLRRQVAGLLSDVATERAAAEAERKMRRDELAEASTAISELRAKLSTAHDDLEAAFRRENELANRYRNARLALIAGASLAALTTAAAIYLRLAYGGIPQAIGRGLGELRLRNPSAADAATSIFDAYLNRHEQKTIARNT